MCVVDVELRWKKMEMEMERGLLAGDGSTGRRWVVGGGHRRSEMCRGWCWYGDDYVRKKKK